MFIPRHLQNAVGGTRSTHFENRPVADHVNKPQVGPFNLHGDERLLPLMRRI